MRNTTTATPARTFWAFAAIYLIWGSTYLGIKIAVDELPPFFLAGSRFLMAGAVLFAWARFRGESVPGIRVWATAAVFGTLFFVLGNGLVVWAETRVPSGRTALLASTSPIWTVLIDSALAGWEVPPGRVMLGVLLGFGGLALLSRPTPELSSTVPALGLVALVGASFAWALGSVYAHRHHLEGSPAMATGMKMIGGGVQLLLIGLVAGEWTTLRTGGVSVKAWGALAYLVVFGSIVAFTAFTYLLRTSTPQRVATSAYVNPIVALGLGWALLGEQVTGRMLAGAAVILSSVLLVRLPGRPAVVEEVEVGTMETGEFPTTDSEW